MHTAKNQRATAKARKSSEPSPLQAELAGRILKALNEQLRAAKQQPLAAE